MKISIVTPSFNQGEFIEDTFKSLLAQSHTDLEIEYIVMDGLSTDGTVGITEQYKRKFKKAKIDFVFISKKDKGQADALNKGFKIASGEILGFLNSDDFFEPKVLTKVVKQFENNNIDWGYGGWNFVNREGKRYGQVKPVRFNRMKFITYGANIGQPSVFFRKELLKKAGGLSQNLHLALDYDLWLRFLKISEPAIFPFVVANMRYYSGTKSSENMLKHNKEAFLVAKKHLPESFYLQILLILRFILGILMIKLGRNVSQRIR